jgi:hypothetical protein
LPEDVDLIQTLLVCNRMNTAEGLEHLFHKPDEEVADLIKFSLNETRRRIPETRYTPRSSQRHWTGGPRSST